MSDLFPTDWPSIQQRIAAIDPVSYAKTRNFSNGAVTRLSPYISRGFLSTQFIFKQLIQQNRPWQDIEKLVQELAWRDYWQLIWEAKGNMIFQDLKQPQPGVRHREMPAAVIDGQTGIQAIDESILDFYETGYMHNHMRMYTASLCCPIAKAHWQMPSQWMYYHLLDGDLASNTLSWQWVAGSFSNKQYVFNQENLNKYFNSQQRNTFIDLAYDLLPTQECPMELSQTRVLSLSTDWRKVASHSTFENRPTLIFNYYNLDFQWHVEADYQRVLLLEPSLFKRFPISEKCIQFLLELAQNIPNLKIFKGEVEELERHIEGSNWIWRAHPLNRYPGVSEPAERMTTVSGYYPSFFQFWKKAEKELQALNNNPKAERHD